ncbi:hypothetical protein C8R44DRAFT_893376 [Mycena epipterygia]|nr:hypothetical protein C8R44DRAFT_893376 [Mycena epipterygia]
MSYASHLDSPLSHEDFFTDHVPGAQVVEGNGEALGSKGRVMSHREQEALGMWAATMKVMAGTQMLLPTEPTFVPVLLPHPRFQPHARPYPVSARPSAPPGSPLPLRSVHITTTSATAPATGILRDASAACTRIMRVAQVLERRGNAQRRLNRKRHPRSPLDSVVRSAPASTVPAVSDDRSCRAATARSPQPSAPTSLNLVGLLSEVLPSPSLLVAAPLVPSLRTYIDVGTESTPTPTSYNVGIDVPSPRSFSDAAVSTHEGQSTTYGVIQDRFARDLARMLPWNIEREHAIARTIWLDDWEAQISIFERMPPFLRIYLHTLFMLFRPTSHLTQSASIPPGFAPVVNFFHPLVCECFVPPVASPSGDAILQPVLQYGGAFWTLATWCLIGDQTFFTTPVCASAGATLDGAITLTSLSGASFVYTSSFSNVAGTSLSITRGVQPIRATEALEACGVASPATIPPASPPPPTPPSSTPRPSTLKACGVTSVSDYATSLTSSGISFAYTSSFSSVAGTLLSITAAHSAPGH